MDDKFISVLTKIDTSNPKASVQSVYAIFSAISSLDESGVIAAYQTYRFYFEGRNVQDDITEERINRIDDALINRMMHLCSMVPEERRVALAYSFVDAIGDPFWITKFKRLITA